MRLQRIRVAALLLALAIAAGCGAAGAPVKARVASAGRAPVAARTTPSARTPEQSFVAGYTSFKAHNFAAAIPALDLAAKNYPELGDYALFYLGSSESGAGDYPSALETFNRLSRRYPESVLFEPARLKIAQLDLRVGDTADAQTVASALIASTSDPAIEQGARMAVARALLAQRDWAGAYYHFQQLRARYPRGDYDSAARKAAWALLRTHPQLADVDSEPYQETEAAQLLREAQPRLAFTRAQAGLALSPTRPARARLLWIEAQALRMFNADRAIVALDRYLALAPQGPRAPSALNALGHIYWNRNDTRRAREYFERLTASFPKSSLAPEAMYSTARSYEDDSQPDTARAAYLRLIERYPHSHEASRARFRAAWMLYATRRYRQAAPRFAAESTRVGTARARDRARYWEARALEKSGDKARAHAILVALATSIDTNYYPALAERRVAEYPAAFAPATAPDPSPAAPAEVSAAAEFHLSRALILAHLHLPELEIPELKRLAVFGGGQPQLRGFVLARFQEAGGWYEAIVAAERMAKRREIDPAVAERVRYPRGYWNQVQAAARRENINPYLLLAVMRQESLFNPVARSSTGARGLMQLEPATARKAMARAGSQHRVATLNLYDPETNIEFGAIWLRHLLTVFKGDRFRAVAAYNGGQNAVDRWSAKFPGPDDEWVENIGYRETRDYVRKVIGGMREYRLLYGRSIEASSPSAGPAS